MSPKRSYIELERLLREVQVEQKHLSDIFENAPSFMCILRGPYHIFERANERCRQLVGAREIIGKRIRVAFPEIEKQGILQILDHVFQTGEIHKGNDIKIRLHTSESPDKFENHWLDFVYQPIKNIEDEVTGIFVQGVDLTKQKRAEKTLHNLSKTLEERVKKRNASLLYYQKQLRSLVVQLNKTEEDLRRYLATELHDNLGQILAMCKMELDLLRASDLPDHAASNIDSLTGLMNEAIHHTRKLMSEFKPPPVLHKEDMETNLLWVADKMKKYGLTVVVQDDGKPKSVPEQVTTFLLQSVQELLMNIIKHSGVKEARVTSTRLEDQIQVVIEDKGEGFNPEGEFTQSTDGGFGLFNMQERMQMLGGSFKLISAHQQGTKATLIIPLKRKGGIDMPEPGKTFSAIADKDKLNMKSTILIADDHKMIRKGLRNLIDREDDMIVIAEASDGAEVVKLAGELSPDVILMDIDMPNMNGIKATAIIKTNVPSVRIVGLSLHDDKQVSREMRKAGASAYLTKTEAFETLCTTIRRVSKQKLKE